MKSELGSVVNGIHFPYDLSDNDSFLKQSGYGPIKRVLFRLKVWQQTKAAEKRLKQSIDSGECYYGPFKGEMGHFLAHTLPFLMYLHKHGVKIHYCGMELHKAYLVDDKGQSLLHSFFGLRDFFHEVAPSSNSIKPPADVQQEIEKFEAMALRSNKPFWNIGDDFYYWFVHRHWLGNGYTYLYNLSRVYQTANEKAICIFPRSKGAKESHNNGQSWDYVQLIERLKPFCDKVYVVGHPSQSLSIAAGDKVELRITSDNAKILEAAANSKLIITQHSGINNLGEYLNKQVLIIYKGGKQISDIGSMNNTLLFRNYMHEKIPLQFAFTEEEVELHVKTFIHEHNT